MENKSYKVLIWLLSILIILVSAFIVFVIYNGFFENKGATNNVNTANRTTNIKNDDVQDVIEITPEELVSLLKTYYITKEKDEYTDVYQNGNVEYWNISEIKYLGYYKNREDIKYYVAMGNYKCKDSSYNCIYMEQLDDISDKAITFKSNFGVKDGKINHIDSLSFDDMVIGREPDVSKDFVVVNEVVDNNMSMKKVKSELIVDAIDDYFNEYKNKNKIGSYDFEIRFLEEKEYCNNYQNVENRVEVSVSVTYKNLVGESFVLTGNDDNTHNYNKDIYEASAVYVLVKDGEKYKVYDFYTGC